MILVSGGAGYIGSHTVMALRDRGREVLVLDDLQVGAEALISVQEFSATKGFGTDAAFEVLATWVAD